MKKLSQFVINEEVKKVDVKEDAIKKISTAKLEKYLDIVSKFISSDSKDVIEWFINHPKYADIIGTDSIAEFINSEPPTNKDIKPLYKKIRKVAMDGKILEIPFFQSTEQFNDILSKEVSLDEIMLDFTSEKGRNEIAKKYDALCWKVVRQFEHKSNFDVDDLYGFAQQGLVYAMNTYGKKNRKKKTDDNINVSTFLNYASWCIRNSILEAIKNEGHIVRIPSSVQSREKKEKGSNVKSNSVSLDNVVSTDKEGNTKTLADKIGDYERGGKDLEHKDIDKMWKEIKDAIEKSDSIKPQDLDIFYSWFGLFGHKKLGAKELMKKYNFKNQSNINASTGRVIKFLMNDKKLRGMLNDINELIAECMHDDDMENRENEPYVYESLSWSDKSNLDGTEDD